MSARGIEVLEKKLGLIIDLDGLQSGVFYTQHFLEDGKLSSLFRLGLKTVRTPRKKGSSSGTNH